MSTPQVSYQSTKSPTHNHVEWIELHGDGVLHECAVMKRDAVGNVFLFETNKLDAIDRRRLAEILMDRNAERVELWDLMANKTLGNGVNGLAYFHQLVRILTPQGKIVDPKTGQVGMAMGTMKAQASAPEAPGTPAV